MHRLIQLTLDLFDRAPAPAPAEPPMRSAAPARPSKPGTSGDAVAAPAEPFDRVMAPAAFSHPRANREALLGNSVVGYEFKRGKRRTIGFVVGPDGLVVSAPRWVPLYEVDAALREKSAWILSKLDEARERRGRMDSARIEWKEGATLPFLGETVILVLDPRHAFEGVGAVLHSDGSSLPGVPRHALHLGLAHNATPEQIRDAVQAWLMRQAKRVFTERLDHFSQRLNVQWHKLSLSNAGTRWGTAKADGSIRLNWRLIHFRQSVIDYVVAHELSHLRVMDHSPRFWDTVRTVVPDYAELRGQLKDELLPRW
ncbi:MAG: SprT family zinc-dependent metalloprotease [Polaromonas sp.]|uniref:M48 family metallopeptidase n=1 Tax=Polaromonas sp. TaxID=1869339 RepID=UPI0027324803|nr:SprT family zinc-dependent metalloprotease [Polaromonas sp.]MDP3249504.1 SprT family zinc-dependent metalloprotease [Polaromonas sp.]